MIARSQARFGKIRVSPSCPNASAFIFLLLVVIFAATGICSAQGAGPVPRVLILYPYDERIPATNIVGEAARTRLVEATSGKVEVFSEFLDLSRFPKKRHVDRIARYLAEKYSDGRPDLVIALGEESTRFIVANRNAIAPNAKIVFGGFGSATAEELRLPNDVVGALTEFEISKTVEMAIGLQPDARQVVVIAGSAEFDKAWIAAAHEDLIGLPSDIETTYLTGLSIEEFVERVAALPPDTIVIVLTVLSDRTGRNFVPRNSLEKIAKAASAPVYGPYSTYLDHGVVGGNAATFESTGAAVAGLAIDALAGKAITNITVPQSYMADSRELRRWGFSESDLPLGTAVLFKERSLWQEYWKEMIAISAFVAAQSLVIVSLVLERRRRAAAEFQARHRLLEVIHLNQSATAGALSASIAHELNQPLGAIRINAETAALMLERPNPDLKLIQQILADIRDDDQRAGDIIDRMRGLLRKRSEIDWQEFDLNDVVRSAIHILHPEAQRRDVTVSSVASAQGLPVRADRVHVQQVILNLAINAMDAMLQAPTAERNLMFQTTMVERNEKVEVSISDTGSGIPSDKLSNIFDAFYTTKPTGTGLGLSIARVIIEIYGGKLWADNRPQGGAVFRFVLPLARPG